MQALFVKLVFRIRERSSGQKTVINTYISVIILQNLKHFYHLN